MLSKKNNKILHNLKGGVINLDIKALKVYQIKKIIEDTIQSNPELKKTKYKSFNRDRLVDILNKLNTSDYLDKYNLSELPKKKEPKAVILEKYEKLNDIKLKEQIIPEPKLDYFELWKKLELLLHRADAKIVIKLVSKFGYTKKIDFSMTAEDPFEDFLSTLPTPEAILQVINELDLMSKKEEQKLMSKKEEPDVNAIDLKAAKQILLKLLKKTKDSILKKAALNLGYVGKIRIPNNKKEYNPLFISFFDTYESIIQFMEDILVLLKEEKKIKKVQKKDKEVEKIKQQIDTINMFFHDIQKAEDELIAYTSKNNKYISHKTKLKSKPEPESEPTQIVLPEPLDSNKNTDSLLIQRLNYIKELDPKKELNINPSELIVIFSYAILMEKYGNCPIFGNTTGNRISVGITYDRTLKNSFKIPTNFGPYLMNCINRGEQIIIFPLLFADHTNILIYRPYKKIIERYEPYGVEFRFPHQFDNDIFNEDLKRLFEKILKPVLKEFTPKYIKPVLLYPSGNTSGFQKIEEHNKKIIQIDYDGNSVFWSLFMLETIYLNPLLSTEDIIENILNISKSDPKYLISLINGYKALLSFEFEKFINKLGVLFSGFKYNSLQKLKPAQKLELNKALNKILTDSMGRSNEIPEIGGKIKKSELKQFVDAGYKKKKDAKTINGYQLDTELSTKRDKVYYDPKTKKAVHTIAGTDKLKDWSNNLLIPLGLHKLSNRYKNSERIQKEANSKYGKANTSLVSHSQSGNIADNLAKKGLVGDDNVALNPAIIGFHDKGVKVVKSKGDPVSLLTITNKKDKNIATDSWNPLYNHSTKIL